MIAEREKMDEQGLYRIANAISDLDNLSPKNKFSLDIIREEMLVVSAYFREFEKDIEEIKVLKDKLHRRNMQIRGLKKNIAEGFDFNDKNLELKCMACGSKNISARKL